VTVLRDPVVLACIGGLFAGAAVMVVVLLRMHADRQALRLEAEEAEAAAPGNIKAERRANKLDDALSSSPLLRRAVEVTADLASRRGALGSLERTLRSADLPLRPAELILAHVALTATIPLLVLVLTGSLVPGLLALALFGAGPPLALRIYVSIRRKRFNDQLPDALMTLAGSLRAGRSIGQAMEGLSKQSPDPLGRELRKIVAEIRLGRPLQEALKEAADRIGSPDFGWVVLSIQIQAEVGGNLASLLDGVADTMRDRARMRGEVKALTAEGRASAMMLVVMPPGLALAMFSMNPTYMSPMITTGTGKVLLGISALMIGGGYAWMNSMVKIDV
jgi:tight adherence protein B